MTHSMTQKQLETIELRSPPLVEADIHHPFALVHGRYHTTLVVRRGLLKPTEFHFLAALLRGRL